MQIGIRKEPQSGETRVAITPVGVARLLKLGYQVVIESNAGADADFTDAMYEQAGATVTSELEQVYAAPIVLAVNPPMLSEVAKFKEGTLIVSFVQPAQNTELVTACQKANLTLMAMDMVPRISRAQAMDALSSLANIAGYRAVIEASAQFGRFLNGQITAAGKIPPAKVLVIGAGVAGLAAIGTAKNLGAVVKAFDARAEVKEQVQSMGAQFLTIDHVEEKRTNDGYTRTTSEEFNRKSAELYAAQAKEVDIIITTAAIPGRQAPLLLTKEMVDTMKPGSVIVDLAASTGGNCAYTVKDQVIVTDNGVKVVGYTNYQAILGKQSSELYSNNLVNLFTLLTPAKQGQYQLDQKDVIVRNMLVLLSGVWEKFAAPLAVVQNKKTTEQVKTVETAQATETKAEKTSAETTKAQDETSKVSATQGAETAENTATESTAKESTTAENTESPNLAETSYVSTSTLLYPPPPISVSATPSVTTTQQATTTKESTHVSFKQVLIGSVILAALFIIYLYLTSFLPAAFIDSLNIFMLASVLGYFLIWNVHSALHTPLMSLTNAFSGIVVIGAIFQLQGDTLSTFAKLLALVGVFLAGTCIFGGFAVTQRMLSMFIKKDKGGK